LGSIEKRFVVLVTIAITLTLPFFLCASEQLTPSMLSETLLHGTQAQRSALGEQLQLRVPGGSGFCDQFTTAQMKLLVLESGLKYAALTADSRPCQTSFVVLMRRSSQRWTLVRTFPIFSKYDAPEITFPELVSAGVHEIMIKSLTVAGPATGFWQYDAVILKMLDGVPVIVFDCPAVRNLSVPEGNPLHNSAEWQESKFSIIPNTSSEYPSKFAILEKRTTRQEGRKVVYWNHFYWDPVYRYFFPMPTSGSEVGGKLTEQ
jgi:hypothetical protein